VVHAAKRLFWSLRAELLAFTLWLLFELPLTAGAKVRAHVLGYFLKSLGSATILQRGIRITNPEKVSIGSHCSLARGVFIAGRGGVRIGDWVGVGPDVKIWSVNHRYDDAERPFLLQGWERKAVVIEDDVWLGANVFVMPGVTIGTGAIVSAGTVVSKSVPAFALVAGNPGRVIGWRKRPPEAPDCRAEPAQEPAPR
jgi:acetyltransferase-like isoleucine patch superfamily enzyme